MEAREPFYERAGDLKLDGSRLSEEEVARLIIKELPKKSEIRERS